jgi:membrane carboxypeptidase/penicillin-binding protein PbpC
MTANAWCPARRREWIPTGENPRSCRWHHLTDVGLLTVWPAEYRQWAMDSGMDRHADRPIEIAAAHAVREVRVASLSISSPPDGATYSIDPTLRPEFQSLSLRAVTETPGPVEWIVDQRSLGTMASDRPASWSLRPGRHTFVVRDPSGRSAESTIVVR